MLFGIWTHGSARSYACGWGSWIPPWEEGHFWGVILRHAYICLLSVFSPLFTEISSIASTGYKYCSNLFKMSGLRSLSLTNCIKCWMRQYLAAQWAPVSETASRQRLHSAASHQLTVPSHQWVTYGGRAFAVTSLSTWNSLPKRLHDPSYSISVFGRLLKTLLFSEY